ncbi:MAG TPA: hypothetical protein PLI72_02190 [Smithellaceae bacterium]|jgi:hypothetical protein|nr:hypothetical protein [Smithellaceae bacterium]
MTTVTIDFITSDMPCKINKKAVKGRTNLIGYNSGAQRLHDFSATDHEE